MKQDAIQGGCYCGDVVYQVRTPAKWCAHCHCSQCRHTQAAPVVTWFGVNKENFCFLKGEEAVVWFQSSGQAKRGHCRTCGTPLFFMGDKWQDEVHITRESTESDIGLKPKVHVFYDRHVDYLNFDDDLKKYGGENGFTELSDG